MQIEFGKDVDGQDVISFHTPETITIKPVLRPFDLEPESQLAAYVKARLKQLEIPAKNCFYDSTGKGTLGYAFATVFGNDSPIAIDSGAKCTSRPVRFDLFVEDTVNGRIEKRLKRCDEHYSKFITETYFSVSEAIRSKQVRDLPDEVMKELCLRIYKPYGVGGRIELEPKSGTPTKPGFKERIGYSPGYADCAAICVEGARRLGFQIRRLGSEVVVDPNKKNKSWLTTDSRDYERTLQSKQLQSA